MSAPVTLATQPKAIIDGLYELINVGGVTNVARLLAAVAKAQGLTHFAAELVRLADEEDAS